MLNKSRLLLLLLFSSSQNRFTATGSLEHVMLQRSSESMWCFFKQMKKERSEEKKTLNRSLVTVYIFGFYFSFASLCVCFIRLMLFLCCCFFFTFIRPLFVFFSAVVLVKIQLVRPICSVAPNVFQCSLRTTSKKKNINPFLVTTWHDWFFVFRLLIVCMLLLDCVWGLFFTFTDARMNSASGKNEMWEKSLALRNKHKEKCFYTNGNNNVMRGRKNTDKTKTIGWTWACLSECMCTLGVTKRCFWFEFAETTDQMRMNMYSSVWWTICNKQKFIKPIH